MKTKKKHQQPLSTHEIRSAIMSAFSEGRILMPGPGEIIVTRQDGSQYLANEAELRRQGKLR